MGDFNIDMNKYHIDSRSENLYDSLLEYSLIPIINTTTRPVSDSLIDQIFLTQSNVQSNNITSGNITASLTDHNIQYAYITHEDEKTHFSTNNTRNYRRIYNDNNIKRFVTNLEKITFNNKEITNTNFAYNEWMNIIYNVFEICFPLSRISRKMTKNKPWFDKYCNITFKKKCKLYKAFLENPNSYTELRYKQCNKYYKNLIKKTKNEYDKKRIDSAGNDSKKIWRLINNFLGNFKQRNPIYLKSGDEIIEDNNKIANIFNIQFNSVGNLFGAVPLNVNDYSKYLPDKQSRNFTFKDITFDEMKEVIRSLNTRKSSNDIIPLFLIKTFPDNIIERLICILNRSIIDGNFPEALKCSKIIPVFKTDSRLDCKNYRPISLLSYIDKIFEKLISSRLYDFLMDIDFFCKNQYEFRSHHSPEYALLSLMDRVYKSLDSKRNILLISVDLRKAFEVIKHNILISKLENAGIRDSILKWFSSYLTNRKHQTFVNNNLSEPLYMKTGIPQGSCLGPLLFLIYINDIKQVFNENEINIFADDTVIIIIGDNIDNMKRLANSKLSKLHEYLTANGIQLNNTKSQFMIMRRKGKQLDSKVNILINNEQIREYSWSKC